MLGEIALSSARGGGHRDPYSRQRTGKAAVASKLGLVF
jgi:hypothetical protein